MPGEMMNEYLPHVLASAAVVTLYVLRRASLAPWPLPSRAEWLALAMLALTWLAVGISAIVPAFGFMCILLMLLAYTLTIGFGIAEVVRVVRQVRRTESKRLLFDLLQCVIAIAFAGTAIYVITAEPLWV